MDLSTVSWSRPHAQLVAPATLSRAGAGRGRAGELPPRVTHGQLVAPAGGAVPGITRGIARVIHGQLVAATAVTWSRGARQTAGRRTVSGRTNLYKYL